MYQGFIIIACAQIIYEAVLGLQKKKSESHRTSIINMSCFLIAQNFLGAIDHLIQETGIDDLLVELLYAFMEQ